MDENAISISVSDDEREFIDSQIAAGRYSDEQEVLHAGLAVLERHQRIRELRDLIAEGDAQFERGEYVTFDDADDLTRYIVENAEALRKGLLESQRSGESERQLPEIMDNVKAKLRANGTL